VGSKDTEDLCLKTGHIGIYVSSRYQQEFAPKIANWLRQRETAPPKTPKTTDKTTRKAAPRKSGATPKGRPRRAPTKRVASANGRPAKN
jgi:polyhydroxyalkanoate synthase